MPNGFTDAQVPSEIPETFLGNGMMGGSFENRTFSRHCKFLAIAFAMDETLACINFKYMLSDYWVYIFFNI